jgi:hypothetical protein
MDHIRAHPEEHGQAYWICGTTACIAGRATLLAGYEPVYVYADGYAYGTVEEVRNPDTGEELCVWAAAEQLMQLTYTEAARLFGPDNELADLEQITEPIIVRQRAAGILPASVGAS